MQVTALISNATPMPRRSIHMKTACAALSVKTKLPPQVGWKDTCPFSPPDPPAHTPFSLWTSLPHPATPNGNGSDPREAWTFNTDETSQQLTAQYTSRSIMSFRTKKGRKKKKKQLWGNGSNCVTLPEQREAWTCHSSFSFNTHTCGRHNEHTSDRTTQGKDSTSFCCRYDWPVPTQLKAS